MASSSNTNAALPSIATFFSDSARVRVLPLPDAGAVLSQLLSRGRGRPGQQTPEQEQEEEEGAAAWAQVARMVEGSVHYDGAEQEWRQPGSTLPWLWVAVGLVGVGLTTGGRGDGDKED